METFEMNNLDAHSFSKAPHSLGKLIEWKLYEPAVLKNALTKSSPLAGETN
jgi:hypothetical protein